MLIKAKSLILTSDRLFQKIAEKVEQIFPVKKITWEIFSNAIAEAEQRSNGESMLVLTPLNKENLLENLYIFIESIEGNRGKTLLLFPLYGDFRQKDKILQILLKKIRQNNFSVQSGGIEVSITLPFAPIEVRYGETNGNDYRQRAFMCPDEVIKVT